MANYTENAILIPIAVQNGTLTILMVGIINSHISTHGTGLIPKIQKGVNIMKIEKNCDVCGNPIKTTEYGGGRCKKCGWIDDTHQLEYPNCKNANNLISLNRAKLLWNKGKKLLPSFDELIDMMERGFEFQFIFQKHKYFILLDHGRWLLICEDTGAEQIFGSVYIFKDNATIDDIPLRTCWAEVSYVDYE